MRLLRTFEEYSVHLDTCWNVKYGLTDINRKLFFYILTERWHCEHNKNRLSIRLYLAATFQQFLLLILLLVITVVLTWEVWMLQSVHSGANINTHCFSMQFKSRSEVIRAVINQGEFWEEPLILMPNMWTVDILTVVLHFVCAWLI